MGGLHARHARAAPRVLGQAAAGALPLSARAAVRSVGAAAAAACPSSSAQPSYRAGSPGDAVGRQLVQIRTFEEDLREVESSGDAARGGPSGAVRPVSWPVAVGDGSGRVPGRSSGRGTRSLCFRRVSLQFSASSVDKSPISGPCRGSSDYARVRCAATGTCHRRRAVSMEHIACPQARCGHPPHCLDARPCSGRNRVKHGKKNARRYIVAASIGALLSAGVATGAYAGAAESAPLKYQPEMVQALATTLGVSEREAVERLDEEARQQGRFAKLRAEKVSTLGPSSPRTGRSSSTPPTRGRRRRSRRRDSQHGSRSVVRAS